MISKISNSILYIIITLIIIVTGTLVLPRLFGYQLYGVLSGSMEPKYGVGSVVYVKNMDPYEVKIGDAITFYIEGNDTVATHRVIEINLVEQSFITKGDANKSVDGEPISFERLIGRVDFNIPLLGYVAMYIQTKEGIIACIGVFLFIIFLSLLGDVLKKDSQKKVINKDQKSTE